MKYVALVATILFCRAQDPSRGGRITGVVLDESGASIGRAKIRAFASESFSVAAALESEQTGRFQIAGLAADSYRIRIERIGFRSRTISGVVVLDGETNALGGLVLSIAGCDAPGTICDCLAPPEQCGRPPVRSGNLTASVDCELDFAQNSVHCPSARTTDVKVVRNDGHIYLTPLHGASIGAPDTSREECRKTNFGRAPVAIDGLGAGDDICIRTHQDLISHVFVTGDIEPDASQIKLWQVTRKP